MRQKRHLRNFSKTWGKQQKQLVLIMKIDFETIPEQGITLFIIDEANYAQANRELLKHYVNKKKYECVYVTVNKPFEAILDIIKKEKIDHKKVFFIDCIKEITSSGIEGEGNCMFVGSPNDLTNISIAISEMVGRMKGRKKILFFDSLSTLTIYHEHHSVEKFAHFISNKMREWKMAGAFISLKKESDEKLISMLSQFCDKMIILNDGKQKN